MISNSENFGELQGTSGGVHVSLEHVGILNVSSLNSTTSTDIGKRTTKPFVTHSGWNRPPIEEILFFAAFS